MLPIDDLLPPLRRLLADQSSVVLCAEPGAGKTTGVPPALLGEPWLERKKILMLEPRRLAASRAAAYMAGKRGEPTGGTIGFRIRGQTSVGPATRIEVVTEGVLTRLLHADAALPGYGVVIFDEFHERSLHADLGLALTLDVRKHLRPDLRIVIMSATLDTAPVAALLGNAPVLRSTGRTFPVSTRYLPQRSADSFEETVSSAILRALRQEEGDVLVFLPGQREIRRVEEILHGKDPGETVTVRPLYGEASAEEQKSALDSAGPGRRKVILATSIAETSLTIDGVRIVIDGGLSRLPRFDPRRGMPGLVTLPVSKAAADQRRGRAGRQAPGVCYRLWTEQDHRDLPESTPPEITAVDLASLALDFAMWGTPDGEGLEFLDRPPAAHLTQARDLLRRLGAVDRSGKPTLHGRAIAGLPVHPRLGHMIIRGKELGAGFMACSVAALLEERDLLRGIPGRDIDLRSRWLAVRSGGRTDTPAAGRIRDEARRLAELAGVRNGPGKEDHLGMLLALAYPERVALRREATDKARYQTAGGPGAILPAGSSLTRESCLAIGETDGSGREVKVHLAEPFSREQIRMLFADQIENEDEIVFDDKSGAVIARRSEKYGALVLSSLPLPADDERILPAFLGGIRKTGLGCLPWCGPVTLFRDRSEWIRGTGFGGPDWPDLSDRALLETLEEWLGPFLEHRTRLQQLDSLDLAVPLKSRFRREQLQELDRLAPTHLTAPTGSRIPVEYRTGSVPVMAVRIQEMFGQTVTPTVAGGKVPVVLHLLSPARRPLAVTGDLPSFWTSGYPEVRKTMRGRYPKHYWPENPLEAEPTRGVRRRAK